MEILRYTLFIKHGARVVSTVESVTHLHRAFGTGMETSTRFPVPLRKTRRPAETAGGCPSGVLRLSPWLSPVVVFRSELSRVSVDDYRERINARCVDVCAAARSGSGYIRAPRLQRGPRPPGGGSSVIRLVWRYWITSHQAWCQDEGLFIAF